MIDAHLVALANRIASVADMVAPLLSEEARHALDTIRHAFPTEIQAAAGAYYLAGYDDALRDAEATTRQLRLHGAALVSGAVASLVDKKSAAGC